MHPLRPTKTRVGFEQSRRGITEAILVLTMTAFFGSAATAQRGYDPPWSAERIARLPASVRASVLAICPQGPVAGHYFATYFHDRITLHFEYFHCPVAGQIVCNGSKCLRQVYEAVDGHYRRTASYFATD